MSSVNELSDNLGNVIKLVKLHCSVRLNNPSFCNAGGVTVSMFCVTIIL